MKITDKELETIAKQIAEELFESKTIAKVDLEYVANVIETHLEISRDN